MLAVNNRPRANKQGRIPTQGVIPEEGRYQKKIIKIAPADLWPQAGAFQMGHPCLLLTKLLASPDVDGWSVITLTFKSCKVMTCPVSKLVAATMDLPSFRIQGSSQAWKKYNDSSKNSKNSKHQESISQLAISPKFFGRSWSKKVGRIAKVKSVLFSWRGSGVDCRAG